MDDLLGHVVRRGGLAGEDDATRRCVVSQAVQDGVVVGNHMQHVQQLPLVFVNTLDLHVEQAVGVERDACLALDVLG